MYVPEVGDSSWSFRRKIRYITVNVMSYSCSCSYSLPATSVYSIQLRLFLPPFIYICI